MGSNPTPPKYYYLFSGTVSLGGIGRRGRLKIYFLRSTSSILVVGKLGCLPAVFMLRRWITLCISTPPVLGGAKVPRMSLFAIFTNFDTFMYALFF